jgi:hypothetical protein
VNGQGKLLLRLLRPPQSLSNYCWWYGAWNLIAWSLVFWISAHLVFNWMQHDGVISLEYNWFLTIWMAFFAGFVGFCTSTLYPRLKLLSGRLAPTPSEWTEMEAAESRSLAGGFWKPALFFAVALAVISAAVLGGVLWVCGDIQDMTGFKRLNYGFYTVILPSIYVAVLSARVSRRAVVRFVIATERNAPLLIPRRRYIFLHNVLPYAIFSSTAGIFSAFARFASYYESGELVPVPKLSVHLSITALVIAILVVGAARLKTRVDFLSPIVLTGKKPAKIRASWRMLYAFCVPLVVYFVLRVVFWVLEVHGVEASVAIALKVGICLTTALSMSYWAVTSVLARLEDEGLEAHPIVRVW